MMGKYDLLESLNPVPETRGDPGPVPSTEPEVSHRKLHVGLLATAAALCFLVAVSVFGFRDQEPVEISTGKADAAEQTPIAGTQEGTAVPSITSVVQPAPDPAKAPYLSASIPGICRHEPTTLVNGVNESITSGPGMFELLPETAQALPSANPPAVAVVAVCTAGAVGWPNPILFFTPDGTYIAHTLLIDDVDWSSMGLDSPARTGVQRVTVENGRTLILDVLASRPNDGACCPTGFAELALDVVGSMIEISEVTRTSAERLNEAATMCERVQSAYLTSPELQDLSVSNDVIQFHWGRALRLLYGVDLVFSYTDEAGEDLFVLAYSSVGGLIFSDIVRDSNSHSDATDQSLAGYVSAQPGGDVSCGLSMHVDTPQCTASPAQVVTVGPVGSHVNTQVAPTLTAAFALTLPLDTPVQTTGATQTEGAITWHEVQPPGGDGLCVWVPGQFLTDAQGIQLGAPPSISESACTAFGLNQAIRAETSGFLLELCADDMGNGSYLGISRTTGEQLIAPACSVDASTYRATNNDHQYVVDTRPEAPSLVVYDPEGNRIVEEQITTIEVFPSTGLASC